jgi:hypothetical protein
MVRQSLLALTLAACGGASNAEVREARTARYTCDYAAVLNAARTGVTEVFPPLGPVDPSKGMITSEFRWYEQDGSRQQAGAAEVGDRAVSVAAIVTIKQSEGGYVFTTAADVRQIRAGLAAPQPLAPDDPDRPEWVQGKLDKLAVEIHGQLRGCVATPAPAAPAPATPATPPSPDPATPPATPDPATPPATPDPAAPAPDPTTPPTPGTPTDG